MTAVILIRSFYLPIPIRHCFRNTFNIYTISTFQLSLSGWVSNAFVSLQQNMKWIIKSFIINYPISSRCKNTTINVINTMVLMSWHFSVWSSVAFLLLFFPQIGVTLEPKYRKKYPMQQLSSYEMKENNVECWRGGSVWSVRYPYFSEAEVR